jgi:hypothetical protein
MDGQAGTSRDILGMAHGIKEKWNKIREMIGMVMGKEEVLDCMAIDAGV